MTRVPRRLLTGTLAALLVVGLLPGAVLAADPVAVADTVTTAEDTARHDHGDGHATPTARA